MSRLAYWELKLNCGHEWSGGAVDSFKIGALDKIRREKQTRQTKSLTESQLGCINYLEPQPSAFPSHVEIALFISDLPFSAWGLTFHGKIGDRLWDYWSFNSSKSRTAGGIVVANMANVEVADLMDELSATWPGLGTLISSHFDIHVNETVVIP
jgi:hypothetical protein